MNISSFARQAWSKAVSYFEPKPILWADFSEMLNEPESWIGSSFVSTFAAFADQPEHKDHLAAMDAQSSGANHVFVEVKPDGRVNITALVGNAGITDWQSKPDGSTHRGFGLRDMEQGPCGWQVDEAVEKCFAKLSQNPHLAGAVALARESYSSDVKIFERDPGTLDNLAYKNS